MRVFVGCEYSGVVRDAFAAAGHDAWSCDILPTDSPGNHYQGDIFEALKSWAVLIWGSFTRRVHTSAIAGPDTCTQTILGGVNWTMLVISSDGYSTSL